MANESTVFKERFALVDKPSDYYTIVAFVDLFEYVFRLNEIQMMDQMVWKRWNVLDRKSTRLNSSHRTISYAVFCLKKKNNNTTTQQLIRAIPPELLFSEVVTDVFVVFVDGYAWPCFG